MVVAAKQPLSLIEITKANRGGLPGIKAAVYPANLLSLFIGTSGGDSRGRTLKIGNYDIVMIINKMFEPDCCL